MLLRKKILAFDEGMSVYGALENYLRGIEYAEKDFKADTALELYGAIEQQVALFMEKLKEVQHLVQAAPPSFYGNFYHYQKRLCDRHPVELEYDRWKRDVGGVNFDLLKDKQTLVVEEFLKRKILRFTQTPSEREIKQVDLDKVRPHLPYGYELPDGFEKCCARFRRFIVWDGDILKMDYDKYGNYLFQYYYDMTAEERRAFIEFDIMLDLIHEDMALLKKVVLPAPLATPEAMILWQKAMAAGWVDECFQPKLSITLSAMLAFEMAIRLELKDKWKTFETFWHRNNMRSNYNSALKQRQSLKFQDRIKQVFK